MAAVDHRAVVAGLTAGQREQLLARSDWAGLRHLLVHLGALAATTTLIAARTPLWPIVMIAQGILLNFLFTTLHETVHRTPFKTRWLNELVGRVCGFAVLLGPRHFRHFHLAHHRFTHDPENDPELASPHPRTTWQYVTYMSGFRDWSWRLRTLLRNAVVKNQDSYVPERAKTTVVTEARIFVMIWMALLLLSLLAANTVLVRTWLLPLLLGGPFLRGYLLAEHAGCPQSASMFENTRTTFTNKMVRRLAWNMPFHAEHHAFPAVPFHRLPAFHEHTRAHLRTTQTGYLRFNWDYATRRHQPGTLPEPAP